MKKTLTTPAQLQCARNKNPSNSGHIFVESLVVLVEESACLVERHEHKEEEQVETAGIICETTEQRFIERPACCASVVKIASE